MKAAFNPIANDNSRILILGTIPGERSIELQQYYGHKGNQFWRLMFDVFEEPITDDYKKRVSLLIKNKVALWDVLRHCEREGSADSKIKNEIANDFTSFYILHPNIRHIYFGSKEAEKLYKKHLTQSTEHQYSTLPSPSRANTWKTYEAKLTDWKIILSALS